MEKDIKLTNHEAQTLLEVLELGIGCLSDEDGEDGYMVLQFNENGELAKPDIEKKTKTIQSIIDRIELVK